MGTGGATSLLLDTLVGNLALDIIALGVPWSSESWQNVPLTELGDLS